MNGPDILALTRDQLLESVAQHSTPLIPDPLPISPWVAMSLLQKAIRRGEENLALRAAATLLRDAPDRLWRRLGCIAFEDVGVADLDAVRATRAIIPSAPPASN
jgi:replication-associated recombination protein RarA